MDGYGIVDGVSNLLTLVVGAVVGWLTGRRKNAAEAVNTELDAARKAREEWELLYKVAGGVGTELRNELMLLKQELGVEKKERKETEANCAQETDALKEIINGHELRIRELEHENHNLRKNESDGKHRD